MAIGIDMVYIFVTTPSQEYIRTSTILSLLYPLHDVKESDMLCGDSAS